MPLPLIFVFRNDGHFDAQNGAATAYRLKRTDNLAKVTDKIASKLGMDIAASALLKEKGGPVFRETKFWILIDDIDCFADGAAYVLCLDRSERILEPSFGASKSVSAKIPSAALFSPTIRPIIQHTKKIHPTDAEGLLPASAKGTKALNDFPWRLCLAGGWLDQPWVSELIVPRLGSVVVVNIKPHPQFKIRSGLATSTRAAGMKLWRHGSKPPTSTPPIELARMLFGVENPPGVKYISGAQDALGLMLPGINRLDFKGGFWPTAIVPLCSNDSTAWLQKVLWLVPLPNRPEGFDPLKVKDLSPEHASLLADASRAAWDAICAKDAPKLGLALKDTMAAWSLLLPCTVPQPQSKKWCAPYETSHGYLFSGAGGGFLMVISDSPVEKAFQVTINTIPWAEQ